MWKAIRTTVTGRSRELSGFPPLLLGSGLATRIACEFMLYGPLIPAQIPVFAARNLNRFYSHVSKLVHLGVLREYELAVKPGRGQSKTSKIVALNDESAISVELLDLLQIITHQQKHQLARFAGRRMDKTELRIIRPPSLVLSTDQIFGSKHRTRALVVCALLKQVDGLSLAKAVNLGSPHAAAHVFLGSLVRDKVLAREKYGQSTLYSLPEIPWEKPFRALARRIAELEPINANRAENADMLMTAGDSPIYKHRKKRLKRK